MWERSNEINISSCLVCVFNIHAQTGILINKNKRPIYSFRVFSILKKFKNERRKWTIAMDNSRYLIEQVIQFLTLRDWDPNTHTPLHRQHTRPPHMPTPSPHTLHSFWFSTWFQLVGPTWYPHSSIGLSYTKVINDFDIIDRFHDILGLP